MACPSCAADNDPGRKFCWNCGAALGLACPACGTPYRPHERFCGECGVALPETPARDAATFAAGGAREEGRAGAPAAERRLVSVLFADLVGFTGLSEHRDAEEVRALLSRYFDLARQLIERYGGVVEKFIGDAVMAVWGTPVAQEDDAERAVRAALDLTAAVAALGTEIGVDLQARAGVLTGEAAVTLGAQSEGMVAGDLVNTASRIQSAAPPGGVLVGEATRRATDAAIAYQEAGTHELKGKAEPVPLWQVLRVVGGRGGALRSAGLEAPFVGRDRELRHIKDLFHASADDRKAHLVFVTGVAGIGKSRLSWEFFKYLDGLADTFRWHRGRCLAYGEGVAFWALAEMVRMRAGIAEEEEPASALDKLRATVEEFLPDAEERQWVEPRLAHLLGLEDLGSREREDLFSAWRLFFERMAELQPVVLVFEDLQWADSALLDFVAYLLDWSRNHPVFVLALARPEVHDRHPSWAAATRSLSAIHLEPLPDEAMAHLLGGLAPGLPHGLQAEILRRAEGVPLYAVETVRMLIDRGLLVQDGAGYRLTGSVDALEVPETLHALIAARLDGLPAEERRLLQRGSVLGKSFTRAGLATITGMPDPDLEPLLASLVRKEVLSLQADARSPERGQYGFLQDLVRRVAYETLSKRDRKELHLAAATRLEASWGGDEDEVVEVVASHYLEAYPAAPEAEDAGRIKDLARSALARAGRRAGSLGANVEAQRYFERAIELADEPAERAGLAEQAGMTATDGGRGEEAIAHLEEAVRIYEELGLTHPAARVSARLGDAIWWARERIEDAIDRLEGSFALLAGEEPDQDLAVHAAELARLTYFHGDLDLALERVDVALRISEDLWLPGVLSQALNTKHLILAARGREEEALALLKHSLEIALENDEGAAALRAYANLSNGMLERGRNEAALEYEHRGIELARRRGSRSNEWFLLSHLVDNEWQTGDWDAAAAHAAEVLDVADPTDRSPGVLSLKWHLMKVVINRGRLGEARELYEVFTGLGPSDDVQSAAVTATVRAIMARAEGRLEEAVAEGRSAVERRHSLALGHPAVREGFGEALEAAVASGNVAAAEKLLAILRGSQPGRVPPFLRAQLARFDARLAALRGDRDRVEPGLKAAAGAFRENGLPFFLAVTLLEHAEWLSHEGHADRAEPLLAEAQSIFGRLRAEPWLERADRVAPSLPRSAALTTGGRG